MADRNTKQRKARASSSCPGGTKMELPPSC